MSITEFISVMLCASFHLWVGTKDSMCFSLTELQTIRTVDILANFAFYKYQLRLDQTYGMPLPPHSRLSISLISSDSSSGVMKFSITRNPSIDPVDMSIWSSNNWKNEYTSLIRNHVLAFSLDVNDILHNSITIAITM